MPKPTHNIDVNEIETSIRTLKLYMEDDEIKPIVAVLEQLKAEPNNEEILSQISAVLSDMGVMQGAVLTYAPYVKLLMLDDPFGGD